MEKNNKKERLIQVLPELIKDGFFFRSGDEKLYCKIREFVAYLEYLRIIPTRGKFSENYKDLLKLISKKK